MSQDDALRALESLLGHRFKDRGLLRLALTHSSAQDLGLRAFNERLEFLGDRVLGLIAASRLFSLYPDAAEGALAPRLNALVNKAACARAARRVGLGACLILSKGEEQIGGRDKDTILADAAEAVMAALYLDGGLGAAEAAFDALWGADLETLARAGRDPKTHLQEWAAQSKQGLPVYKVVGRAGPDHAPSFSVEVTVGALRAVGEGGSKQEAERQAARQILLQAGLAHERS